jgi:hypothetical protein
MKKCPKAEGFSSVLSDTFIKSLLDSCLDLRDSANTADFPFGSSCSRLVNPLKLAFIDVACSGHAFQPTQHKTHTLFRLSFNGHSFPLYSPHRQCIPFNPACLVLTLFILLSFVISFVEDGVEKMKMVTRKYVLCA